MNSERNVLKLINDISNLTLFVVDQSTLQILYCNQTAAKAGFRRGVFYHLTLSALMPSIFIRVIISILLKNLF